MNNQEVAEFHGMSLGGFKHWTPEQRRRARIEAEMDATPEVAKLIADLNRLAYVFDCKNVEGENQIAICCIRRDNWRSLSVSIYQGFIETVTINVNLEKSDAIDQLKVAIKFLEGLIYGAAKNAR